MPGTTSSAIKVYLASTGFSKHEKNVIQNDDYNIESLHVH